MQGRVSFVDINVPTETASTPRKRTCILLQPERYKRVKRTYTQDRENTGKACKTLTRGLTNQFSPMHALGAPMLANWRESPHQATLS